MVKKKKTSSKPKSKARPKAIRTLKESELNTVRGGGKRLQDAKKWG